MKKALVLLSGGLDSTTCLAVAMKEGFEVHTISFDYGQRHSVELTAARRIAQHYGVASQLVVPLPFFREIGGSALTDSVAVPKGRSASEMSPADGIDTADSIPVTYVPARTLIFLSIASATAEVIGANDLFIGVNALDYSGYPDCRPDFIRHFQQTARLATRTGVVDGDLTIHTPLMELTKAEIVTLANELGAPLGLTHSCYDPIDGKACGACDSCLLRLKGFAEAGVVDPVPYLDESAVDHVQR